MNNNSIIVPTEQVNALSLTTINAEINECSHRISKNAQQGSFNKEEVDKYSAQLQDLIGVKNLYLALIDAIREIEDDDENQYPCIPICDFDITINGYRIDAIGVEDGQLTMFYGDPTDEDAEFEQLMMVTLTQFSTFGNELLACL